MSKLQIVIGGDVCPIRGVEPAFARGDAATIFNDLIAIIADADLSIVNLECPLISVPTPIRKVGRVFGAKPDCIAGFRAAGWHLLNIANNHSFDHGAAGLRETIATAERAGLRVVGAGMNLEEARKPLVTNVRGRRIVVYAMAEREFSAADTRRAGANPLDLIGFVQAVRSYKQDGMFVVLLHGGMEGYRYPPPEMVRKCRFLVEMGADAVVCCHAHCPLPWEVYQGRPIAYGLGNLVFRPSGPAPAGWYEGYLARLTVDNTEISFEALPYRQLDDRPSAKRLMGDAEQRFLAEMQERNHHLQDGAYLEERWLEYCRGQADTYLAQLLGYSRMMWKWRWLLFNFVYSEHQLLGSLNVVQCETHREVINTIFRAHMTKVHSASCRD